MQKTPANTLLLSATDLTNDLACRHLTLERRKLALGLRGAPRRSDDDAHAELIRERGDAHERVQLERLIAEADGDFVDLTPPERNGRPTLDDLAAEAARTADAMASGARLIFQASFLSGRWQGRTDFLRRIEEPSALGAFSYEVLDTKLARQLKPHVVHQLCLYNRLVGLVQGRESPFAWIILGDGRRERVELGRYMALHRRVAAQLETLVDGTPTGTYPEPVAHCPICTFEWECRLRRRADDHLSLVAGARRDHRSRLSDGGISSVAGLAGLHEAVTVPALGTERLATLRRQAALQVESRETERPTRRQLPPSYGTGYGRLPEPSPGDIFFDLEGDPYVGDEGGIEYLWGWSTADGYEHVWAHDTVGERDALQQFVAFVEAQRARHPDLHVFHYAPHERSKLTSLALRYAVCETTIDDWLRSGVLVDLYGVVRQGLQVGEESYSLKALERHHGFVREEKSVRGGGGSIIAYENWLRDGDERHLAAIRDYNREDCESTASLYRWLVGSMRSEARSEYAVEFGALAEPPENEPHDPPKWLPEMEALIGRLRADLPADAADDTPDDAERRLLSQLLLYHYRENKLGWRRRFELAGMTVDELIDERDAVAGLTLDPAAPTIEVKKSLGWTYRFPAQEAKLKPGTVLDPITGSSYRLHSITDDQLVLLRSKKDPPPEVQALIDPGPPDGKPMRAALARIAEEILAGEGLSQAARSLLRRSPPRLDSGRLGPSHQELISATLGLDHSVLPVQGPPGTGKTYRAARMIVAAIRDGQRVAVTAQSHAALRNLLDAVEAHATEEHVAFVGVAKSDGYESTGGAIVVAKGNDETFGPEKQLVAGTSFLLSADGHVGAFDTVFVDEAGQYALASAVAIARCARNVVLLGDPQQLAQVSQAEHPEGADASVLGHLLGDHDTLPEGCGVLLTETWRMHPDVTAFISELSYEGRLHARPGCSQRRIDAPGRLTGTGLRTLAVEHEGRSQSSPEEAEAIGAACRELVAGGTVTNEHDERRPLEAEDILVVAPYNLAVQRIRRSVPHGVQVGTVDSFQGREAPVVFYALTCSSGEDVPRGLDFLFSRNRLNVAVSRAQCLAILVYAPRLLDADCKTLHQMELLNGACRFVEMARDL